MCCVTIAIDSYLEAHFAPEVHWAWRTLLAGLGAGWHQVSPGSTPCDIAYVTRPDSVPSARLCIRTSPDLWEASPRLVLQRFERREDGADVVYAGRLLPRGDFRIESGRAVCDRDLVFDFFWLASGQDEPSWPQNRHGHAILTGTPWVTDRGLVTAPASGIATRIGNALEALGWRGSVPRWPGQKRAAAAPTHDVDYPEIVRWLEPVRILKRQGPGGLRAAADVLAGRRTHWCFDSWMQAEQSIGIRSAFYFLARKGSLLQYATGTPDSFYDVRSPRFQAVLRGLASGGWEIGLQASYRAFEAPERFVEEKQRLEEASGLPVLGHRHHYFHMDPREPEDTLLMHEHAGFAYDSSLAHDGYAGWRRGLCWPFYPFHRRLRREIRTLQLPLGWMDAQLLAHRRIDRQAVGRALDDLVRRVAAESGLFLADVHEYVFDDVLYPGWAQAYLDLVKRLAARGDFWMATPRAVAEHWMRRHARICQESTGLE
jgi:hypothetical protein